MKDLNNCPFCGKILSADSASVCPFCRTDLLEDSQPTSWKLITKITPFLHAFQLYTIYWITTFVAIKNALSFTLFYKDAEEYLESGIIDAITEYGWNDHFIWFSIVVGGISYACALLCGATTKRIGGIFSALSNIPIGLFLLFLTYLAFTDETYFENALGWKLALPISAIASFICSYCGGVQGQIFQDEEFEKKTVLGIRPIHWLWIWIFWGGYLFGLATTFIRFIVAQWSSDESIFSLILLLIVFLPLLAYFLPMYLMYQILTGEILEKKLGIIKFLAFIGIYLFGFLFAMGVEWVCMKLLYFLSNLF